jgi:hypothetical protein
MGSPSPEVFRAFTLKFGGPAKQIVTKIGLTPAFNPKDHPGKPPFAVTESTALWDTGATGSFLTSATVKTLKLVPTGTATINHAGGTSQNNTYVVNLYLPNRVAFAGVIVTEVEDIKGDFGVIIGMDIITSGDFAITNVNQKTWVSYRIPSTRSIDYVAEQRAAQKAGA